MQFLDARRGKGSWDSDTWMQYGAFLRALVLGAWFLLIIMYFVKLYLVEHVASWKLREVGGLGWLQEGDKTKWRLLTE